MARRYNAHLLIAAVPQTRDALFDIEWHHVHGIGHLLIGVSKRKPGVRRDSDLICIETLRASGMLDELENPKTAEMLGSLDDRPGSAASTATAAAPPVPVGPVVTPARRNSRRSSVSGRAPLDRGVAIKHFLCSLLVKAIRMNHSHFERAPGDELSDDTIDDRGASVMCDGQRLDLTDAPLPSWMLRTEVTEHLRALYQPSVSHPKSATQGTRRSSLSMLGTTPSTRGVPPSLGSIQSERNLPVSQRSSGFFSTE